MKQALRFGVMVLVALAATPAQAQLQFHGYTRAGVGLNVEGGGQVCFQLAGADTKWRLGNECDYVIEPTFIYDMVTREDKSVWGFVVMPSIYKPYDAPSQFDDLPTRFGQVYFRGQNVPQLLNGTIWAGRRFYDRLQLGINDQFLENEDGDGAGLEDMDLGFAKWSVAFLMNPNDAVETDPPSNPVGDVNNKVFKLTTRLTGIKTMTDGALQIWLAARNVQWASSEPGGEDPAEVDATYRAAVYHTVNLGPAGNNFLGFKYDHNQLGKDSNQWRVVMQHAIPVMEGRTTIEGIAEYRRISPPEGDALTWLGVGARGDAHISGPFRFLLEAGFDQVDNGEDSNNLTKVTGCLAVSPGLEAGVRPTFRLFYTHGFWSEEGVLASPRTNDVYGGKTSGGSFGVQAEGWW
jgi:maltoporin